MNVSLSQIAARSRVTPRAVSYALNGQPGVSSATRARIQRIAAELGYLPNAAARVMRSARSSDRPRTGQIGVLVRNDSSDRLTHLMAFETILGINEGLEPHGFVVSLVRVGDVSKGLDSRSRVFEEHVLDGLIVLCEMPDGLDQAVQKLIPHVIWVESQTWAEEHCLRRDEVHSGRRCAEAMIDLGYRNLVWLDHSGAQRVDSGRPGYSGGDREAGVRAVADAAGVPVRTFTLVYDNADTFARCPDFLRALTPGTAVIAGQAYQARWLAHAAAAAGLTPPHHFGLCSCDDGYDVTSMWPGLCRVSFDRFEMGVRAAEMLRRRVETPDELNPSQRLRGQWRPGNTAWGPTA